MYKKRNDKKVEEQTQNPVLKTPCSSGRRLGMRKRSNKLLNSAAAITTPQTDTKITYESLEDNAKLSKISSLCNEQDVIPNSETPCSTSNMKRASGGSYSDCRPYRLTLNKRLRQELTKKKLEFHLARDANNPTVEEAGCNKNDVNNKEFYGKTKEELIARIKEVQSDLKKTEEQKYEKQINELKEAIEVWKNGFNQALNDLQDIIEPREEKSVLLTKLRIPLEMLKYIND